jgi:spore germination protein YaaH
MRRVLLALLTLIATAAAAEDPGRALGGWLVPWQYEAGVRSAARAGGAVGDVFLFIGRIDDGGHPVLEGRKDGWTGTVARAHETGARAWLTMVNDRVSPAGTAVLKDADVVERMLADPTRRSEHRAEIVALAKDLGVDGVDVDYENLPAPLRLLFTRFARELAADLRAQGLLVSITVQPKSGESASRGPGAMDWQQLCTIADRLQVMLYNEHNAATEPGPVASLDWISRVADYGLSACPAAKLIPVLKVSGMDWGPDKAEWRSFADASSLLSAQRAKPRRDRRNRVPWFAYKGGDGRHVVYYEDARSLVAKAERLRDRGLTRIVLWSFGSEDPEAIASLATALRPAVGQKR